MAGTCKISLLSVAFCLIIDPLFAISEGGMSSVAGYISTFANKNKETIGNVFLIFLFLLICFTIYKYVKKYKKDLIEQIKILPNKNLKQRLPKNSIFTVPIFGFLITFIMSLIGFVCFLEESFFHLVRKAFIFSCAFGFSCLVLSLIIVSVEDLENKENNNCDL